MATKTRKTRTPITPPRSVYRIRSMFNGNGLGCVEATNEAHAIEVFNAMTAPYPPLLDVYAQLTGY